ncbi:MAG TPA: transcription elongation factor GreA [Planctomycetota bacterium]|jgi:transcription elongation factor GreA|nr:transcription elongation factor GreA [Planctomycetota bacterium]
MDRVPMTPEGYEQARKRLDHLKNVEMPRVQKALGEAREMGDLSENAEFDAAREEMWKLDTMIGELETKLSLAEIFDPKKMNLDTVAIGATVKVEDVDRRGKDEFMLVGEGEIRDGVDTVSVTSPLGAALIGKKVGEIADFQAPRGRIRYKIVSFKYA